MEPLVLDGGRLPRVLQLVCSMTMGWSLLYTGQWLFWAVFPSGLAGHGSKMLARVVMAIVDSSIAVVAILVVDFLADRLQEMGSPRRHRGLEIAKGLRTLMSALGLLLGLAWEAAFDQALEHLVERF